MTISNFTISDIKNLLKNKEISAKELVSEFLKFSKNKNKELNAFLFFNEEKALKGAEEVDKKIMANENLRELDGVPIAIKDNILIEDLPCTAASKILKNYIASYNATVIEKLKEAGAIILGKTNLDEFAMGSSTENSAFGPTKNPWDTSRVPGGSSGGSAAAVAAGMVVCSLGSDTGGSIRQPASFCGVLGLKPTYGAVSRYGLMAMASSLDQIGPFGKTIKDVAKIFKFIVGKDNYDSTSVDKNWQDIDKFSMKNLKGIKIGVPLEYFISGIDKEVEKAVKLAIKKFEDLGAKVEEISLPHTEYALATYYLVMPAEVSANLARYDGIKYGYSYKKANNLLDVYLKSRQIGFGDEVRRRIILGTYVLSAGYYDAYYLKAQKVRTKILEDFKKAFEKVDLIFTPTSPTLPFKFGERIDDPLTMYLSDIFTVPISLAGLPALSLPCDYIEKDSQILPVGLQIIADHFNEKLIFEAANLFEQNFQYKFPNFS